MAVLDNCEPKRLFHYFEEICNIPHPSYHEKAISDYLVAFAKEHGLEYYQDHLYNVIMIKEASAGYEDDEPILIQGHMDMVAEKEADCAKDMYTEGLDLEIVDGFVQAKGTTLGGDDGIAVAIALALLEDDTLKHPRLEVIITVSEEVGMEGAQGIDVSMLRGRKLLNLDSEAEGIFTAGCAGGCRLDIKLPVTRALVSAPGYRVEVKNATGGHSGTEIDKGRANASFIVNRILTAVQDKATIGIYDYQGGKMDNAIPRQTSVEFAVISGSNVDEILAHEAKAIQNEYAITDPDIKINIAAITVDGMAVIAEDSAKIISLMNSLPNGVQNMSHDIEGLVETSLNLGVLHLDEKEFCVSQALRSSVNTAKEALIRKCINIAHSFGAATETRGMYPAWEYVRESSFRDKMVAIHEELFGKAPVVETIHAGLECGLLAAKLPGLDAVSIGPELYDIHTPQERLSIESTERMYAFVRKVIETR